jgi:hypothetical protein
MQIPHGRRQHHDITRRETTLKDQLPHCEARQLLELISYAFCRNSGLWTIRDWFRAGDCPQNSGFAASRSGAQPGGDFLPLGTRGAFLLGWAFCFVGCAFFLWHGSMFWCFACLPLANPRREELWLFFPLAELVLNSISSAAIVSRSKAHRQLSENHPPDSMRPAVRRFEKRQSRFHLLRSRLQSAVFFYDVRLHA